MIVFPFVEEERAAFCCARSVQAADNMHITMVRLRPIQSFLSSQFAYSGNFRKSPMTDNSTTIRYRGGMASRAGILESLTGQLTCQIGLLHRPRLFCFPLSHYERIT